MFTEQQKKVLMDAVARDTTGEQATILQNSFGGDVQAYGDWLVQWWSDEVAKNPNAITQYPQDMQMLSDLGFEVAGGDDTEIPLEQDLLTRAYEDYILPDMDQDPARRAAAQASLDRLNAGLDQATAINARSLDGTRLTEEYAQADAAGAALRASAQAEAASRLQALDAQKLQLEAALARSQSDRTGALDAETAQLQAALTKLETERGAALQQLEGARISSAETAGAAVRQGLEAERDRINAADAMGGFYGGSTFNDAALTRAGIGAQQQAAMLLGDATVANATDRRALGDDIATTRFDLSGRDASGRRTIADDTAANRFDLSKLDATSRFGIASDEAAGVRSAADTVTNLRTSYFDNDYTRRLEAALRVPGFEAQRIAAMTAADEAGQSGLRRSLDTLNWFNTGSGGAPTSQPYYSEADTSGSDIAGLGAGLISAGFNYGNSQNWGRTPKTTTPTITRSYAAKNNII